MRARLRVDAALRHPSISLFFWPFRRGVPPLGSLGGPQFGMARWWHCSTRTLPHLHAVADAADLCRRGVEISRAAFGEEDSRYAVNVNNYALALCPLGTLSLPRRALPLRALPLRALPLRASPT